jgi:hypothetical protein
MRKLAAAKRKHTATFKYFGALILALAPLGSHARTLHAATAPSHGLGVPPLSFVHSTS